MSTLLASRALLSSVVRALEETAFVFADPVEDPAPFPGEIVVVDLQYVGDQVGTLRLVMSQEAAQSLASTMLGLGFDEVVSDEDAEAAALEILNIIAGFYAIEAFGEQAVYEFRPPQRRPIDSEAWSQERSDALDLVSVLTDEGERLDLAVFP